jgi:hypothetical protein
MKNKRRLIRVLFPRIQGRFLTLTLSVIATSLLVHSALSVWSLTRLARELPSDGELVQERIVPIVLRDLAFAFVATAPAFALLAMAGLMGVIGPLFRMRRFLEEAVAGRHPEPCTLRQGDELQDVCKLLNTATEPLRARQTPPAQVQRAA